MNRITKYFKTKSVLKIALVFIAVTLVVVACSITIDSIDQPDSVDGGGVFNTTLHVTINTNASRDNAKFMVSILVPQLWSAENNATVTFTSSITTGTQTMSLVPAGTAAPNGSGRDWEQYLTDVVGNGGNLLAGWEWVTFYSDNAFSIAANATVTVKVNISIKVSQDNVSFKLGYVVGNNSDGLSDPQYYTSAFPGCFRVFGTGDLIDFCNPQLSTVDPMNSLDNDIITLNFDGGIIDNALADESNVYLCAKGITDNGDTLSVCRQDSTTLLTSYGIKKWRIDLWPRELFNLTSGEHLAGLQYYFTDPTGTVKVGKTGDASTPFTYTFKCQ